MSPTLNKNTPNNVNWLKSGPIAHRALHDVSKGIFENTLSAARQAMENGYAIEVDLQPSSDGVPMVFHDYKLQRMTGVDANTREMDCKSLQKIKIHDTEDTIPTLQELLDLIQGKVGIVLELKGLPGKDDGFVEAVAAALDGYEGNVAIMSFNHHLLEDARKIAPHLMLGLTAEGEDEAYDQHQAIAKKTSPDFISYELKNLDTKFVREFVNSGKPSISWTVRSQEDAAFSSKYVDQITFEGFTP